MRVQRSIGRASAGRAALALALAIGPAGPRPLAAAPVAAGAPPTSPVQEDPAAELYHEGREALNRGRYMEAARLLARLTSEHPTWERAGDALYWNAYALYRMEDYRRALAAVERVLDQFPRAADRGDAETLRVRIEGALARRGDAEAAARVARQAMLATATGAERVQRQAEVAQRQAEVARRQAEVAQRQAEVAQRQAEGRTRALRGRRGDPLSEPDAQEACEEAEVQTAALNALLMMDSDRALPVLERVLARRDECSEPLRVQATRLLAQRGGEPAGRLLLEVVRGDPSPEVRGQAVFWLSQVEGEPAVAALEEVLAGDADPELQQNALFALSRHPSERAFQILRAYALDESRPEANRAQAIFRLGRHEAFGDLDLLAELYGRLASEELKVRVLHAVAQNADEPGAVDWLVDRVLDEGEPTEVRKQALFWAGRAGVGIERLDELYGALTDREMKLQLAFVYAQSDEEAAVERLIEIARTETDPEIRKQAIFWLGQSDDPRAAEYLVQLLESP